MGVVFLGEHALLRRRAAIKVLPLEVDCPLALCERFYEEARMLAELQHPHIVQAFDAGEVPSPGQGTPGLIYLVMELIDGGDLEQYVLDHGPVSYAQACDWICQAASGLQEAHDHHLIHRDIKPSNLLLTTQRQVKIVDFGLVRQFPSRLTDPRALLGTVTFMAPEQSRDASVVGAEADIYSLGATLFWLITGETPHPAERTIMAAMRQLMHDPPRRLRDLKPDIPAELDELVHQLLARNPANRPALPLTVMNRLLPFTSGARATVLGTLAAGSTVAPAPPAEPGSVTQGKRILIVDDEPAIRNMIRLCLEAQGCTCAEAGDGAAALATARAGRFDLAILDLDLPGGMNGFEVCRRLRERPPDPCFKILVVSGHAEPDALAESLPQGADDYLAKPLALRPFIVKVQHALQLKAAQEQADLMARHLVLTNRQLEQSLQARSVDVREVEDAVLYSMAKMAESREGETAEHLQRMQQYTRALAETAARTADWNHIVDELFLENLQRCVPLHDIGMIGLPDEILRKPRQLSPQEWALVETHTLIGDRILEALRQRHGRSLSFLRQAQAIVRSHHEHYDGRGYPDKLIGETIPAGARMVAIADVYDALRRQRPYRPALGHEEAVHIMLRESPGHFDPTLLQAFHSCQAHFKDIYDTLSG
jgi:response regulator RpfG family c-di-GMP phosphodiesterase/tRNA A-37 threonylcarbamoyl transferase component Bud32